MTLAEVNAKIAELEPQLRRLDVAELSVFGSVARDEAPDSSDVDLATQDSIKPRFAKRIFAEAIKVA